MKNLFLLALLFLSVLAQAQHGNAIHKSNKAEDPWAIGVNITPEQTKLSSGAGSIIGYTLGAQAGYFFTNNLWLSAGISYSHKGFKQYYKTPAATTNDYQRTTYINYFEVPLYISYRTGDFTQTFHKHHLANGKKAGLIISAGPVAGIIYDAEFTRNGPGGHKIDKKEIKAMGYKNTIGAMASIGAYFQFSKNLFVTVQPIYKITFSNVPTTTNYHWSSIGLNINLWYRILEAHPL